jgi:hypothetical protein
MGAECARGNANKQGQGGYNDKLAIRHANFPFRSLGVKSFGLFAAAISWGDAGAFARPGGWQGVRSWQETVLA